MQVNKPLRLRKKKMCGITCFITILVLVILVVLPCESNPCLEGATCVDNIENGTYTCLCPEGFQGTNCETGE